MQGSVWMLQVKRHFLFIIPVHSFYNALSIRKPQSHRANSARAILPANILYRPDIGPILDSISARYRLPISAQCQLCNSATHRADIDNRYRLPTCSRYCADIHRSSLFPISKAVISLFSKENLCHHTEIRPDMEGFDFFTFNFCSVK